MNYVLFNYGKLPKYLNLTINSILSVDNNALIYFISDKTLNFNSVNYVDVNEFLNLKNLKDQIYSYYHKTNFSPEVFPVFYTSLLRIFAIDEVVNNLNINQFVHFDNDVIIYKSFDKLLNENLFNESRINITQNRKEELVFGYSYFPSIETISFLSLNMKNVFENMDYFSKNYNKGKPLNEMRMMRIVEKEKSENFNLLPSLPYGNEKIIFDPSSYGQYFNGQHVNSSNYFFRNRWVSPDHIIGREIISKRIKAKIKNQQPYVIYENKKFEIANLHVHSKKLEKFLPKEYKEFLA